MNLFIALVQKELDVMITPEYRFDDTCKWRIDYAIFKNKNKTAPNHPDYRGVLNANGKEMDIALWLRESKGGVKYFSVMLTEPFGKDYTQVTNAPAPEPLTPQKDDLPF